MGVRHEGREAAIQFLYQRDQGGSSAPADLKEFYKFRGLSPAAQRFCKELLEGVLQALPQVDELLQQHAKNYELGRLSAVDRNILRLAIYELLYCPKTPAAVAINEAITIAKKYSTQDSGRFVNGILDKIKPKTDN